ncbi:MAG TPA: hypothetical protein VH682_08640 [Gemmataceae bacterium]|jgi:hypothetical protein
MKDDTFRKFLELLGRLHNAKIAYSLRQSREDAVLIDVNIPGQRWEIEFVDYGDEVQIEIERFVSNGHIEDESALTELFARFSADSPEPTPEEIHQYHETLFRREPR